MSASDAIERKLTALIERAAKSLVLELDRQLRMRSTGTPVDTGHARANWVPSIGAPFRSEVSGTSSAEHDTGVAQVLGYKLASGQMLYVSNNVPYIRRLNDGWSQQAPALFVEACIDRAIARTKEKLGVDFGRTGFQSSVGAAGAENMASAYSPFAED